MIVNITKVKVKGVEKAPDELLRRISKIKEKIYLHDDPKVKFNPLEGKELKAEIHRVARKVAYAIDAAGFTEVYVGMFRTVYCAVLERELKEYGIKAWYA